MSDADKTAPLLSVVGLSRKIGERLIVNDFTFDFYPGRAYSMVGPSGAGKSSVLRLLNRLDEPTGGEITFRGLPQCDFAPCEIRRKIGYLFQTAHLFPGTIRDNLQYASEGISEEEARKLLTRSAVDEQLIDSPVDNLSVGEAQRVALARMLATRPEVVLLDEPTSALDPASTSVIESSIKRLASEDGLCVIMVTHNPEQALRMSGETLLLAGGRLVEHGSAEKIINDPQSVEGKRYRNREMQ